MLAPLMHTALKFTHLNLRPCHIVSPSDCTVLFSEIGLELFVTWRSIGKMEDEADVTSFEELLAFLQANWNPGGYNNGFPQTDSNLMPPDATHTYHQHFKLICSIQYILVKFMVLSTIATNFNTARLKLPFCSILRQLCKYLYFDRALKQTNKKLSRKLKYWVTRYYQIHLRTWEIIG
jgi:hypothetical protein